MKKLTFWKSLFLLCALIVGSTSAWADAVTDYNNIVSGTNYYIRATTGETDYYLSVPSSSGAGTAVTSKSNATVFVFTGSGTSWTIKIDGTSNYLTLSTSKSNGNVIIQSSAATWTASNNTTKGLLKLAANSTYYLQKNNSGTQFGSYGNTQTDIWLEPAVIESHNVTFSVNGVASAPTAVAEGADITFPADPASIGGKVFMGWTNGAISGNTDTKPTTLVTSAKMGTADITYYAVFAKASGTGGTAWVETAIDDISSSDEIVISNGSHAMSNNNGTGSAPAAVSITVSSSKITSNVEDNLIWNVSGNATDGYTFYPNGNDETWLYCNTTAVSSSNNNIRVGTGDRNVWTFDGDGYLVTNDTYTTRYLSIYSSQDFRGYINTTNGAFVPVFYKQTELTTYSEYCTNVTVTLAPAKPYTTLTSAYALDFTTVSDDLKAYIAKDGVSEGSVKMTQVNKVPANTGLVLKATTPGSAVNVPVFDGTGADDVEGNKMVGSATETTAIEKDGGYILSNGVFQPADAGTLAAGKAYLNIVVPAGARSLEMSFEDTTTGINGVEEIVPATTKTRKVVKNGRLVIETANGEFTIDGARMK